MVTPATYDFEVVRGSQAAEVFYSPLQLRFTIDGAPVVYEQARLSVYAKKSDDSGTFLFRTSTQIDGIGGLEIYDTYSGAFAWLPSTEQTRLLKVGAINYYEVELRIGDTEAVFMTGIITGVGGLNDDGSAVGPS